MPPWDRWLLIFLILIFVVFTWLFLVTSDYKEPPCHSNPLNNAGSCSPSILR